MAEHRIESKHIIPTGVDTIFEHGCIVVCEGQHLDITDRNMLPFRHVRNLGMGGTALVEMVEDKTNGRKFAHKAFRRYNGTTLEKAKQAFRNEIEITKRLSSHPHIISVFATYACGRYLGMYLTPVADSGDLAAYLQISLDSGEPPTAEQNSTLDRSFGCLASGLAFIHKHTIRHKDIKPQNILVHNGHVIYADFGIALDASQQDTTTFGNPGALTYRFCAPEVANWEKRNRKSDVFSLACVFVEILTVLEPQLELGAFNSQPYWEVIGRVRDVLDRSSTSTPGRDQILLVCYDMLEPDHEDRIDAAALLDRMSVLLNKSPNSVYKYFCNDCGPKKELKIVCAEAALSAQPQAQPREAPFACAASSSSITDSIVQKNGAVAQRSFAFCPKQSRRPIPRKRRVKPVSGATVHHQSRPSSIFNPSLKNLGVELDDILADEDALNHEVAIDLIKKLSIPSPSTNPAPTEKDILFPAHLINLITFTMWSNSFIKESQRFLNNVMQTVQQEVIERDGDEAVNSGAFWLSNVHEMLSFMLLAEDWYDKKDGHYRLLETAKLELENLEFIIYRAWMTVLKRKLDKMIVPALIETQSLPGFAEDDNIRSPGNLLQNNHQRAYGMGNLLDLLNNVYQTMKAFYLEDSIITQVLTEMLRLAGVTAFNDMLMRRNFLTWKRGLQINYNLTRIEEWCKIHCMPVCMLQLEHLMQATKLLKLKKAFLNDIDGIQDICWILSPNQMQALLNQYVPTSYEQPINSSLVKAAASRVTKKGNTLLRKVDLYGSGPYELAKPRVLTAFNMYLPHSLQTPRLRRLVEIVSAQIIE
ncbi:Nn.00g096260.m01.CDS01 [Neocucurbitaria sp. VM-36]